MSKSSTLLNNLTPINSECYEDLEHILRTKRNQIIEFYAYYVSIIRESLEQKGVTADHVRLFVETEQATKSDLEDYKEKTTSELIDQLAHSSSVSFLNYGIWQKLVDKFQLDNGGKDFKYPEKLKAFIEQHKISEFIEIYPPLKSLVTDSQNEVILIFDVKRLAQASKLTSIKAHIAESLDLIPSILDIDDIPKA